MLALATRVLRFHKKRQLTKHLSGSVLRRVAKLVLILLLLVIINSCAMILFEGMSVSDSFWLSFTTLTTVGYGDFSPSTLPGRITTILTMYGFAITMLSLLAAEVIEWRLVKTEKKRKGLWEWRGMTDHIQIINTPNVDADKYLKRLISEIHSTPLFAHMPIQLLTRKYPQGLPDSLASLKVLHRTGSAEDRVILHNINLEHAKHIIILSRDATDTLSDSVTFDILSQVVAINPDANIVVESVLDENRARFVALGAAAVLRPIRAYPEMIVRALSHPGTERVLEDLFAVHGDSLHRVNCQFNAVSWGDIVTRCISSKLGTPLAYFAGDQLITHPEFGEICSGDAVAILVKENKHVSDADLKAALV